MTERLFFDPTKPSMEQVDDADPERSPALLPLARLLLEEEFHFELGDFPRISGWKWDPKDTIEVGRKVADELLFEDPTAPITKETVRRLNILGVFPNIDYLQRHFGSLKKLVHEIDGLPSLISSLFDDFSNADLLDAILREKEGDSLKGRVTQEWVLKKYKQGILPRPNYLWERGIGIETINHEIGYPDYSRWGREDYIKYGVEVLRYNGALALTQNNLNLLSRMDLGPHYTTIRAHFRNGIDREYQKLVHAEYLREIETEMQHMGTVKAYYGSYFTTLEASDEQMKKFYGLYVLVKHYNAERQISIPRKPDLITVRRIIAALSDMGSVSEGEVETMAHILQVDSDIWDTRKILRPPIIPK